MIILSTIILVSIVAIPSIAANSFADKDIENEIHFIMELRGRRLMSLYESEYKKLEKKHLEKEIKEDESLKRLLERNEAVRKLKEGEGITSRELLELEKELSSLKPEITIEYIQKQQNTDFILFFINLIVLFKY